MLRAHRLPAVRICLLIVVVVLLSTAVIALAASADPFRAAVSYRSHKTAPARASRRCVANARDRKHRKAGKPCAVRSSKTNPAKPSVARKRSGTKPASSPSVASSGTQVPVDEGAPPAGVSEEPGSEPGLSSEPPGGLGSPPVEPTPPPPAEPPPPVKPPPPVEPATPFRFFSSSSFWNEPLAVDAPLDPSSAAMVGALDEEIAAEEQSGVGPWINTINYSVPVYTVPGDQSAVAVQLVDHNPNAALSAAWSAVPLPPTAKPAAGTDGSLVVWQPSTDRLWEFHRLVHEADGTWEANWGGAMQDVSSNPGVYGPEAWPGAQTWWGISASSLSLVGGLISLEDLEKGVINHALEMAIPERSASVYASPAQRTDGKSTNPLALPEGAHLRLNPNLDLAALHMPRLTLMIAKAAQRYGIFITDGSSDAEIFAQDPTPTGTDPYKGLNGYFEGERPNQLLASFPWSQLELLKMELHTKK